MVNRFLLDSMIHDKLVDEPGALDLLVRLVDANAVAILSTHVQRDEIARTPDSGRAAQLAAVPVEQVPTYGFVLDVSRLDMARLSEDEPLESLRRGNLRHTEDGLIGATAHYEDATLVTEDRTLKARARAQSIPVIDWDAFYALLLTLDS